jgi:AraC-like DNA-binding protein
MDRKASTQRCRNGWELRCRGRTWQEIADQLGYKSKHNAYSAVTRWIKQNPPDDLTTLRRATGDTIRHLATRLADEAHHALEEGARTEAATLARAALDGLDRYAKLTGQHIPVEVNVNVTATQALSDTRARLLEAIDAATAEPAAIAAQVPLDAEIVEVVE